jgi:nitroreductase
MVTRRQASLSLLSAVAAASMSSIALAEAETMKLPAPRMEGGKPLLEALRARRSTREYAERPLAPQVLSNLLWAAWGINRPQSGLRTAPSAHASADIDIYLAMVNGVWIYDAKRQRLSRHMAEDIRSETTSGQDFAKTAPLNLIYVSDASRLGNSSEADRMVNGAADSAVIAQNVYLFCASEGLATVLRGSVPGRRLAKRLGLKPAQNIYFAQSVGYPKA